MRTKTLIKFKGEVVRFNNAGTAGKTDKEIEDYYAVKLSEIGIEVDNIYVDTDSVDD